MQIKSFEFQANVSHIQLQCYDIV